MVTIKDVAKQAGVAISTVSNVINDVDVVSEPTRQRVLKAIEQLGYVPNLNGRYLKSKHTGLIGLFVTSITGPYYSTLAHAVYKECARNDYGVSININSAQTVKQMEQLLLGERIDGAIIRNNTVSDALVDRLIRQKLPMVFLDRVVTAPTVSSVLTNDRQGGYMATEYLIKLGHRRIGFIHGWASYDDTQRYEGYRAAMAQNNLPVHEEDMLYGFYNEKSAYNAVWVYLEEHRHPPDAFFASNDQMAIACIRALRDANYNVPNDVSVIGYDNIDLAEYVRPSLSTVSNPVSKVGAIAARTLLDTIRYRSGGKVETLEPTLISRNSCRLNL